MWIAAVPRVQRMWKQASPQARKIQLFDRNRRTFDKYWPDWARLWPAVRVPRGCNTCSGPHARYLRFIGSGATRHHQDTKDGWSPDGMRVVSSLRIWDSVSAGERCLERRKAVIGYAQAVRYMMGNRGMDPSSIAADVRRYKPGPAETQRAIFNMLLRQGLERRWPSTTPR